MTVTDSTRRRKGRVFVSAQTVPQEVQWQEGMLLMPQHFQQLARRQEALLHYHASTVSPYHWGIRFVSIDRARLPDGDFRVLELEAVMPDGLVVTAWPEDNLSLSLAALGDDAKARPTKIHLAVTTQKHLPLSDRFEPDEVEVHDENGSGPGAKVSILRPKLQLLAGEDPSSKYSSFPLAEVEYRDETFRLTRFEPPWLHVPAGSALYNLGDSISSRLRGKAAYLADQVRAMSASTAGVQIAETKAMVHALVGELPAFEALLRSGAAHPFPLYLSLCSLVGHVAGLSRALVPPLLEPYDHNDLFATFEQAETAISRALKEGVHESYTTHQFILDGDTYRLRFDPEWMSRSLVLGVRSPAGAVGWETEKWMDATVIGGQSKLLMLRERRRLGAQRKRIDAGPDLAPPHGVTLFSLSPDAEFVVPGDELVLLNPGGGRRPDEIVLYVRNRT